MVNLIILINKISSANSYKIINFPNLKRFSFSITEKYSAVEQNLYLEVRSMSKIETPVMTSLQTAVEKMMKDLNVPGAAVAVIKDGEVIISEGFGYRNIETKRLLHRILDSQSVPQRKHLAHFH